MNGYGNRIFSMLSSFVIAILDDRAFIVSRWAIVRAYIKEPLNFTFHDFDQGEEKSSDFNINYKQNEIVNYHVANVTFKREKNVDVLIRTKLPGKTIRRVKMVGVDAHFFLICSNPANYEKLFNYGLVERATVDDAREKADNANNKYSANVRLESVLRVGYEVAGYLLNEYWQPKPVIQKRIDRVFHEHFEDNYVIGMQIRTIYLNQKNDVRVFLQCALDIESELAVSSDSGQRQAKRVKWFISTDSTSLFDSLLGEYESRMIATNGTIGHIYSRSKQLSDIYSRTIVDNELLAKCDDIIITGGSTYGFVSAIKAMRMPYYVSVGMHKCMRANLSSPPSYYGLATFR